jgi:hypothetical protein
MTAMVWKDKMCTYLMNICLSVKKENFVLGKMEKSKIITGLWVQGNHFFGISRPECQFQYFCMIITYAQTK